MEIVFGLMVLALIILGLRNRKKRNKTWLKEERFEESGDWIDKRPGERGAYGSLDEEMESNRLKIARQSKINDLVHEIQAWCFENHPDYPFLNEEQLKRHSASCKSMVAGLFDQIEQLLRGREPVIEDGLLPQAALHTGLQKIMLNFAYNHFPKLLDLEIGQIQRFDLLTQTLASRMLSGIGK